MEATAALYGSGCLLADVWEYPQFSEHTHPVGRAPQFGYLALLHPEQNHRFPLGRPPRGLRHPRVRASVSAGHHEVHTNIVVFSDLMLYARLEVGKRDE